MVTLNFLDIDDVPIDDEGEPIDPDSISKDEHVVVYVQWSYQVGGYCFVVPREAVQRVNMTIQQGMRWALTAGTRQLPSHLGA